VAKKPIKPSKKMRAAAWRALHAVANDPEAGDTARVSAARALIKDDPEQAEAEEMAEKASRGRPVVFILPNNCRDGDPCGIEWNWNGSPRILHEVTPEGLAQLDVWLREVHAKLDKDFPPEMLTLPKPKPLTSTERSRARRARMKAAA
jgi:hypothetical protein